MKGIQSDYSFRLSDILALITFFYFCFFIVLWVYGWRTANTSDLPDVTLSWLLATNDTMRLLFSFWLATYTIGRMVDYFIIVHDPVLNPNKHIITAYKQMWGVWIFHLLDNVYGIFTVMLLLGLYGVLFWVVTDPDDTVRTLHYVSAAVAFGSGVALTWILILKRIYYYEILGITHHNPKSYLQALWNNRADLNVHDFINSFNILYALVETGIAIGFTIDSFQSNYVANYGYIEFILSLFITLDSLWQVHEAYFVDVEIEFYEEKDRVVKSEFVVTKGISHLFTKPEDIKIRKKRVISSKET